MESSLDVAKAYDQTALNASLTTVHFNAFRDTGDPEELAKLQTAFQATFANEALIKGRGTDEDRVFLDDMDARYAADVTSAAQDIQAIANGTYDPATADNSSATLSQVTQALSERAQAKRVGAQADLSVFRSRLQTTSVVGIVSILLGMPLVAGAYVLTRGYERKETVHELELERLKQAALTDGLTGLANHRAFQEDLKREVLRAARYERPITVAMMDVDDFKEVNDTNGHAHGDSVLAELAGLMSYMRGQDRAYRVGGDEFALIMPETGPDDAKAALERLRETVEAGLPGVSVSIGFASTADIFSTETLRDHADLALYEAKHRGKNQVAAFNPSLSQDVEVTSAKVQAVRRVLESGEVTSWYQPIYHYDGRRTPGVRGAAAATERAGDRRAGGSVSHRPEPRQSA